MGDRFSLNPKLLRCRLKKNLIPRLTFMMGRINTKEKKKRLSKLSTLLATSL